VLSRLTDSPSWAGRGDPSTAGEMDTKGEVVVCRVQQSKDHHVGKINPVFIGGRASLEGGQD